MSQFQAAAESKRESDSFRQLIRKEISTDEYIRSLEQRVSERHRQSEGEHQEEPPKSS